MGPESGIFTDLPSFMLSLTCPSIHRLSATIGATIGALLYKVIMLVGDSILSLVHCCTRYNVGLIGILAVLVSDDLLKK